MGTFPEGETEGTIESMIGRSDSDRRMYTVIPDESTRGKNVITHYKELKNLRYVSLVECKLETEELTNSCSYETLRSSTFL